MAVLEAVCLCLSVCVRVCPALHCSSRKLNGSASHVPLNGYRTESASHLREAATGERTGGSTVQHSGSAPTVGDDLWIPEGRD